jgi:RNA-binding protein
MKTLTPKRRSELRSEAHKLNPLVIIGDKGLTDEVVAEIDRTLKAHELIKVRAGTDDRKARDQWLADICERLQAHAVQQIGKIFVLYRENPAEESQGRRQAPKAAAREESGRRARAEVVSERGKLRQRSRDLDKKREADVKDMIRKGKIRPEADATSTARVRDADVPPDEGSTGTSRPRSRTPAPRPESGPRRRPRSTSR